MVKSTLLHPWRAVAQPGFLDRWETSDMQKKDNGQNEQHFY